MVLLLSSNLLTPLKVYIDVFLPTKKDESKYHSVLFLEGWLQRTQYYAWFFEILMHAQLFVILTHLHSKLLQRKSSSISVKKKGKIRLFYNDYKNNEKLIMVWVVWRSSSLIYITRLNVLTAFSGTYKSLSWIDIQSHKFIFDLFYFIVFKLFFKKRKTKIQK